MKGMDNVMCIQVQTHVLSWAESPVIIVQKISIIRKRDSSFTLNNVFELSSLTSSVTQKYYALESIKEVASWNPRAPMYNRSNE